MTLRKYHLYEDQVLSIGRDLNNLSHCEQYKSHVEIKHRFLGSLITTLHHVLWLCLSLHHTIHHLVNFSMVNLL